MAESSGSGDGSNSPGGKNGTGRGRVPSCEYLHGKLSALYGSLDRVPVGDTLDLVLFSHLIHHLSLADAIKAFLGLKGNFVDWNEVRISTAGDVQEMFRGGDGPLELAIFLKDFLNRLFIEHHHVGLEFLKEMTSQEIRGFFRKTSGFSDSTVILVLERLREYPVLPVENRVQRCLERLGVVDAGSTPRQRQKDLYQKIPRDWVLPLHAYLTEHARSVCVPEEGRMDCPGCVLKRGCPYPKKVPARRSSASRRAR